MASLQEKLEERRRKQENAVVYEAYGQRRQTFKEGKSRLYRKESCEQQLKALTKVIGAPAVEPCTVEFPPDAELTPEQEQLVAEAPPPGPPPPPPAVKVRTQWEQLKVLRFPQDRQSPEVKKKATDISHKYHLPADVCLRLALLFQFQDTERGVDILEIYLGALQRLQAGVVCAKLSKSSLKVKKKRLVVDGPGQTILIKPFGGIFRSTTRLDVRAVEDVHIGATDSPEFREVNKRIKTLGQRLDESRCCVIKTDLRTYSLIMNKAEDVDDFCAAVDVLKGYHGPAVWRTDHTGADAVFRTDYGMKPEYALRT